MHSLELFDGFFVEAKATAEVHEDSDKHMVFSLHDAHFKLQHFARYHSETVSDHGDVTTFAIVRYGTQEKRTASVIARSQRSARSGAKRTARIAPGSVRPRPRSW